MIFKRIIKLLPLALLMGLIFVACSDHVPAVKGVIDGADKDLLMLEKSDLNGSWVLLDSTRTSADGSFKIDIPKMSSPEIMRLALGDRYIYFPLDSTEIITINSSLKGFDTNFSLEGSQNARTMAQFEKEIINFNAYNDSEKYNQFKRRIYSTYLQPSHGSIVAYYILTKTRRGKPIFDATDNQDLRYFAAVATAFRQFNPDDPRTLLLEQITLNNMKRRNSEAGRANVMQAQESSLIDISLMNEQNREVALSRIVSNGRPTILFFSLMNQPQSPSYNAKMREIDNNTAHRFNIYHVSFDSDMYQWREAARNLPWTTVIDPAANDSKVLSLYNVQRLPMFYIIDASGVLRDKADSFEALTDLLKKY